MHFTSLLHYHPTTYIAIAATIVFAALLVLIIHLEVKVNRLLIGKNAKSLEDSIINLSGSIEELQDFTEEMEKYLAAVEKRLKQSLRGMSTLRYNAFEGTGQGGNNSFTMAFLNEKGDGNVLTSLYAREKVSLFAKPIKSFKSEFELTDEERAAIKQAQDSLQ